MQKGILIGDDFVKGTTFVEVGDGWIRIHNKRKRRTARNPIRKVLRKRISNLLFELYRMRSMWENTETVFYLIREYRRLKRIYKSKKSK